MKKLNLVHVTCYKESLHWEDRIESYPNSMLVSLSKTKKTHIKSNEKVKKNLSVACDVKALVLISSSFIYYYNSENMVLFAKLFGD